MVGRLTKSKESPSTLSFPPLPALELQGCLRRSRVEHVVLGVVVLKLNLGVFKK